MIRLAARLTLFCLYETGCITADQYTAANQVNAPAALTRPEARPTRS